MRTFIHLRAARTSLLVDLLDRPRIAHWGPDLGDITEESMVQLRIATAPGRMHSDFDEPRHAPLMREASQGFLGHPVLSAHRAGTAWSPLFRLVDSAQSHNEALLTLVDSSAQTTMTVRITMSPQGVVRLGASLRNDGSDALTVNELIHWLPVPERAAEIVDFTGRWSKERQMQRHPINTGTWLRESLEGRGGHDHTITQLVMTPQANFGSGEVWATALAWSGNLQYRVERLPDGRTSVGSGEVLLPGELILESGQSYDAPDLVATYSERGIDGISERFYEFLRARPQHPRTPRPLTLNVWEAVYFDHSMDRLGPLAELAAELGVERFVLDDGWFGSRRNDLSGLGDWYVSADVWPEGLHPLVDKVTGLGMQFGLWFEPEMVNPDSELFRAHPDWIMHVDGRHSPDFRQQQVLNIAHPDAYEHLLERMDALLDEYAISYIKWDHNRVIVDGGDGVRPRVHEQTLAFYRLVDELKRRHPGLEIESCASGGARIDFGVIDHTDRFWTSDCTDALERQQMQRWAQVAVPPELLGSHISAPFGHQTARHAHLHFRAITALFGHAGIEWDITKATIEERALIAEWISYYKINRELLHTGTMIRIDSPDEAVNIYGVVARDKSRAIFAYAQLVASRASRPAALRLRGLQGDATYRVRLVEPAGSASSLQHFGGQWKESGVTMTGRALAMIGLTPDYLMPENAFLIEVDRL